jgi:ATP-dependent Clp protease ATP-binding subunit ClpC
MFERFTERARRVIVLAQEEARMLNHNSIGTEHILLGLLHEGDGIAARSLEALDISLDAVRVQVEEITGKGTHAPSGHIPFTPRAKRVLELSLREALQLGHEYISTEHILLGLLREGEGVAAQVLVRLGADLNRVRQQVIQLSHGEEARIATGLTSAESIGATASSRPASVASSLNDIQRSLRRMNDRIAAIERVLSMTGHAESPQGAESGRTARPEAAAEREPPPEDDQAG